MKFVKWDEYTKLLDKIFDDIKYRQFDNVVAIGRGGSIIAAFLSSKMGIPTFCPTFVRHVGRGDKMKIVAYDLCQIDSLLGRILVVDDWLCDGRAMKYILDKVPPELTRTTLVMYCRRGSEFKPDFVGEFVKEEEREIMFPYDAIG